MENVLYIFQYVGIGNISLQLIKYGLENAKFLQSIFHYSNTEYSTFSGTSCHLNVHYGRNKKFDTFLRKSKKTL